MIMLTTRQALFLLLVVLATATVSSAQVQVTIDVNPDRLQGAHSNGELLLNTPDPIVPGSSVSHWDPVFSVCDSSRFYAGRWW